MTRPADLGVLKSVEWNQLQELADRFEKACIEAGPKADLIDLAAFLPPLGDPLRTVALHELIKTDLEIRWRRGQTVPLERYLDRFPELGAAAALPPELIYEEYCVRQRHGDKPDLVSYQARFPQQFAEMQRLAREQPIQTVATISPAPTVTAEPVPPNTNPNPVSPGELLAFGYRKIKRIGSGSFGEVWRAEAPGGVEVALKIINRPIDHEEAQRELQALERIKLLRHPFLLQTQAFHTLEDRLFIIMELADGSLRDRLKQCRGNDPAGIPLPELLRYFRESAEALDYLHGEHVQHRDIKPENILILKRHAKVADFGLARMLESQRLMSATSSGTPAYMAPEVWRGKVSPHSDQYSLAATYAELRLDRSLIASRDMFEVMISHVERKPNLDPLSQAEQEVLFKALAKEPDQRYTNCFDFIEALEAAVAPELRRTNPLLSMPDLTTTPPPPGRPFSGVDTALGTLRPDQTGMPLHPPNLSHPGLSQTAPMAPGVPAEWKPVVAPKPRSRWPLVLLLIAWLAIAGLVIWYVTKPPPVNPFELDRASLTLKAGEASNVAIRVKRNTYQGPIRIAFEAPANVQIADASVEGDKQTADVRVDALPDAAEGLHSIRVVAKASDGSSEVSGTLDLTVQPLAYYLPPGWQKVANAGTEMDGTRIFYKQIDVVRGDIPVRFILIPDKGTPDDRRTSDSLPIPTFYIMEHKVWVEVFNQFTADGKKLEGKLWRAKEGINKNPRYPVMGVYVDDAHQFAVWMGGLLPMIDQWDKACGSYVKNKQQQGPYKGPKVAVDQDPKKDVPLTIDETTDDLSDPYGVRDTAGNGFEWTRELDSEGSNQRVPVPASQRKGKQVALRGWSYREKKPLTYELLQGFQNDPITQRSHFYSGTEPDDRHRTDIGFRVVIEPLGLR